MKSWKTRHAINQAGATGLRFITGSAILVGIFFSATAASALADNAPAAATEQEQILAWRQSRDEGLRRERGWLTLVGLEWLKSGTNTVGSAPGNDIQLPGGADYWGAIELQDKVLTFSRAPDADVTIDGATLAQVELVADDAGEPTVVQSGTIGFHIIFRESYALRVTDSQATTVLNFKGVENYDIQPEWKIEGHLVAAQEGQAIDIGNVLGQVSANPVYGIFKFEIDDVSYELIGLGDESSESLWFIFADRTNGHGTYGAGRFLYSEGLPSEGRLVVDFNKAYNPPCAFNDYATCPLPPQQNRLDLAVTAGEKDYHATSGSK